MKYQCKALPKTQEESERGSSSVNLFFLSFSTSFLPAVPLIHALKWTYQKPPHSHSVFQPDWNQEIPEISSENLFPNCTKAFNTFRA